MQQSIAAKLNERFDCYDCYKHVSAYDERWPKKDPKFMVPIRLWERDTMGFVTPIRWFNAFIVTFYHMVGLMWLLYEILFAWSPVKWQSIAFFFVMAYMSGFGVTAGVHRYWAHRSYKARLPLRIILAFCYSMAGQYSIPQWVLDHRVHHKHSETEADPHDANRGFFFSHVGWLMMRKHPDVIKEGLKIDLTDVYSDPVVKLHTKYFRLLNLLFCFVLPTLIPVYFWGESWRMAILTQPIARYLYSLNGTWAVNSIAHLWGNKPYDKNIMPSENWAVSMVAFGEGWHNYHHTFPWDYKAAELGYYINGTTALLNMFSVIGWAYNMKEASPSLVKQIAMNRGQR